MRARRALRVPLSGWENPPYGHLMAITVEEWNVCRDLVEAEIALHSLACI